MHSIGERLRHERVAQKRSISEIASQTCISSRYLQAIETGDLSALPGGCYSRSFVRQYAEALGLNAGTLETELTVVLPKEDDAAAAGTDRNRYVLYGVSAAAAVAGLYILRLL